MQSVVVRERVLTNGQVYQDGILVNIRTLVRTGRVPGVRSLRALFNALNIIPIDLFSIPNG